MRALEGKKAVIAGVANKQSIAWIISKALHEKGAQLAFLCLGSNLRRVKKLARQVDSEIVITCDVQKDEEIKNAFKVVNSEFDGSLDILVHAIAFANIVDLGGNFIEVSRSGWTLAIEISAYSLVAFARCVRPMMESAGGGSIITLTFGGGELVVQGYNIMGVAKAALNSTVRYLAYDLGPYNIRVNAISPGPVKTLSSLMIEDFETSINLSKTQSSLLRNLTQEDIAGTAIYLASELSSGITGSIIKLECGMDIVRAPSIEHRRINKDNP